MSEFKAFEKMGQKEKLHRTKQGDQTSRVSAQQVKSHQDMADIGAGKLKKTRARAPHKHG